jgi:cytochrome oxidase Cu insertion factor (SCO1/SenC/PrrC family)
MKSKKFPIQFVILFVITALPVIVSTFLFFNHQHFKFKTVNRGELLSPVVDVTDLEIGKLNQKKWRIVYVNDGRCDEACKKLSFQLNAVKKILNKDRDRTQVVVINGPYDDLKNKLNKLNKIDAVVINKIYLVDPLGNLFMSYSASIDPMNILKDLQRLLEVSQIG